MKRLAVHLIWALVFVLVSNQANAVEIFLLCRNPSKVIRKTEITKKGDIDSSIPDPYPEFEVLIDDVSGNGTLNHAEEFKIYKHPGEIVVQRERVNQTLIDRSSTEVTRFTIQRDTLNYDLYDTWDFSSMMSIEGWKVKKIIEYSNGKCVMKKLPKENKI